MNKEFLDRLYSEKHRMRDRVEKISVERKTVTKKQINNIEMEMIILIEEGKNLDETINIYINCYN